MSIKNPNVSAVQQTCPEFGNLIRSNAMLLSSLGGEQRGAAAAKSRHRRGRRRVPRTLPVRGQSAQSRILNPGFYLPGFCLQSKSSATGGSCSTAFDRLIPELIYQKKAEKLLADENCMKIFIYHQSQKMTIELLDTETESQNSEEQEESNARKWNSYIERFIQPGDDVSEECKVLNNIIFTKYYIY